MAEIDRHRGFLQHMEWADARMWQSVSAIPAAQHDARLIALLHHLHLVQWTYLSIWRRDPPAITDVTSYDCADAVKAWARPYYSQAAALVDSMDEDRLAGIVEFPWADQIAQQFGSAGTPRCARRSRRFCCTPLTIAPRSRPGCASWAASRPSPTTSRGFG